MTARTGNRRGDFRQRPQQHVDALELAKLADEQEVGGIGVGLVRGEIARLQRVGDDARGHPAGADAPVVNAADEVALEDQAVGVAGEEPFDRRVDEALRRGERVMQAAAVRRVEGCHVAAVGAQIASGEAGVGAALGAVPMQHVGTQAARGIADGAAGRQIARAGEASHRKTGDAELQMLRRLARGALRSADRRPLNR